MAGRCCRQSIIGYIYLIAGIAASLTSSDCVGGCGCGAAAAVEVDRDFVAAVLIEQKRLRCPKALVVLQPFNRGTFGTTFTAGATLCLGSTHVQNQQKVFNRGNISYDAEMEHGQSQVKLLKITPQ